jgi:hypothetical protein
MHDEVYKQGYAAGQRSALVDAGVVPTADKVADYQAGVRMAVQEFIQDTKTPQQDTASSENQK